MRSFQKAGARVVLGFLAISGLSTGLAQAEACELNRPIVFAGLDWDSNAVHTEIARFIFEKGYGCRTDVLPGTTVPLLNGQLRGDVDVTMEMWRDNVRDIYDPAIEKGEAVDLGVNFPDAIQGWFVPDYLTAEGGPAEGLKSVEDLPRFKEVFRDPEEPGKGRFYNGVPGWGAEGVSTKKLHAYGLTADYVNFRPGSGAALSGAIEAAVLRKRPIVFYYWGPTWLLGKLGDQVTMLEEPPFDQAVWDALQAEEDPEKVAAATAFPVIEVTISANPDFVKAAPQLVEFLRAYETTGQQVSNLLAWMQETDGSAEEAALQFLRENKDQWRAWTPEEVAARVEAAL
ncbi:ABC transporter substrate-binding protein [Neomegalonema sp.]|uniref:ABC transporter substrate-binding protein n=1 Tax=Neomegalonema sp. TaxID=2039713 RepID=UPI00260C6002|nr:ABC transporter substrate-binding protein [Neomegalonema sp.]MDD2869948.1 ABC transporter substrate-binding protein [Neomegalonema sp.]